MISIVAADKEGLKASRLRNFHLRGSSAINYEADVILILNEKYHIVAKVNIEFNPYQAQRFRDWVIVSVEKNRGGQDNVDLEFEALRVLVLRPERPDRPGKADRGTSLQGLNPPRPDSTLREPSARGFDVPRVRVPGPSAAGRRPAPRVLLPSAPAANGVAQNHHFCCRCLEPAGSSGLLLAVLARTTPAGYRRHSEK